MTFTIYEAVPHQVRAVQWTGSNLGAIRKLAPSATAINGGITLLIDEDGREQRALQPGDWVTQDGTALTTVSAHTFARRYQRAAQDTADNDR